MDLKAPVSPAPEGVLLRKVLNFYLKYGVSVETRENFTTIRRSAVVRGRILDFRTNEGGPVGIHVG